MFNGQGTLAVLALAGREVPGIELGTAVMPMPLRSPFGRVYLVSSRGGGSWRRNGSAGR
jgi:hypothetical protein